MRSFPALSLLAALVGCATADDLAADDLAADDLTADSASGELAAALPGPGEADGTTASGARLDLPLGPIAAPLAPLGQDLHARIADADQVLAGTVVALDYAHSADAGPDSLSFPHTFVTLRVDTPLKGGEAGEELTLRFAGGVVEPGLVMTSAHLPLFDVGHEVLLFVGDDNGTSACPLVGCADGLVRFSEGRAYDQHGVELFLDEAGQLRSGRLQDIPEAHVFHIGGERIERNAAFREDDDRIASPGAMAAADLVDWIEAAVVEVHGHRAFPGAPSVDPHAPFVIERPVEQAPVVIEGPEPDMVDDPELEALRNNGMNPVLPPR